MGSRKLVRFDWAMKHILRNKANFDVLEAFLSTLLGEPIKVQSILESESNQDREALKFNRTDLKCEDELGRQIIIEIQNQREVDYLQRILWGASKAVAESLDLGSKYRNVVKVISVSIIHHAMRADEEANTDFIYYGSTELTGMHTGKPLILHSGRASKEKPVVEITGKKVFPEYYMIYADNFPDKVGNELDEWVYFFKHGEIMDSFQSAGV